MKSTKESSKGKGLNKPAGYVYVKMSKKTQEIIQNCINNKIFYGLVNVVGDSMTCNDERSIPHGSGILVYDLQLSLNLPLINYIGKIPMGEPLSLLIKHGKRKSSWHVKTITFLDTVHNTVRLTSFNPSPEYASRWIYSIQIQKIYKVLQVISNDELKTSLAK